MTTYAWPDLRHYIPRMATLRTVDGTQRSAESQLSGVVQTSSMPGARWAWDYELGAKTHAEAAQIEATLLRLRGRRHRISLWDHRRPRPAGTINTAGVTIGAAGVAQFADSIPLAGCGAGTTMLAGDWLGLPTGQLVMAVADATADGAGAMTVEVTHEIRSAIPAGGAVTLIRPTATYILASADLAFSRQPGRREPGLSVSFVEAFA